MTQSDTYVPGMTGVEDQNLVNGLYSRTTSSESANYGGTYVPGMSDNVVEETLPEKKSRNGEPVVGFLYSISRKGIGEYWPLHLGANIIGRSSKCDVQLKEMSVSEKHATLNVKRMKSTNALIASVRDTGSKTGMYLNDEELDYDNHACKNGDVLTVGTCYQLLVILVNANEYGLSVAEKFMPYEEPKRVEIETPVEEPVKARHYVDDGTVDLSGRKSFASPGETKIM